jgi:hypothetical protein
MSLDSTQKSTVAEWIREGLSLSDVQKRLESEFGIRMTYMEVRFLVDDLDLEIQSEGPAFTEVLEARQETVSGKVSVTIDKVRRPDVMLSGQVTFSDGQSGTWHVDQMGRLGIQCSTPGYQPSPEDQQAFQKALQAEAEKAGMF